MHYLTVNCKHNKKIKQLHCGESLETRKRLPTKIKPFKLTIKAILSRSQPVFTVSCFNLKLITFS